MVEGERATQRPNKLSARQALTVSARILWRHKWPFLFATIPVLSSVGLVWFLIKPHIPDFPLLPDEVLEQNGITGFEVTRLSHLAYVIELFVAASLVKGMISYGVFRALRGDHITIGMLRDRVALVVSWRTTVSSLRILILSLLNALISCLGVLIVVFVLLMATLEFLPKPAAAAAMGFTIYVLAMFFINGFVALPIAMIEGGNIWNAFRRSTELSQGHMLDLARVILLIIIGMSAVLVFAHYVEASPSDSGGGGHIIFLAFAGFIAAIDGVVTAVCYVYLRFKSYRVPTDAPRLPQRSR